MTMNPRLRRALEEAVAWHEFRAGKGDDLQRAAFEELEWRRCAADPAYFIDNYGHIIMKDGTVKPWKLWGVQRKLLSEWVKGVSTVAVKARQLGITTLSIHFAFWEVLFKDAARWFVVSKEEGSAKDAMSRLRATKDRLPRWMTDKAQSRMAAEVGNVRRRDKMDAVTQLSYGMSRLEILTSTPKSVQGKSGKFILDEFAAHSDQSRIWQLVLPAFDAGGQAIIIANGEGENTFYHIYQAAKRGDNGLVPHFFSWRDDPTRDDEWYAQMRKKFKTDHPEADDYAFKAQYPDTEEEAFFLHGNSRFDMQTLNHIATTLRDERQAKEDAKIPWGYKGFMVIDDEKQEHSYRFDRHPTGRIRMYEPPQEDATYIVAVDAAGGSQAGDYCVAMVGKVLPEIQGIEQVCVYQAKVETLQLAEVALRLGYFYNEALMVIETGASGHGTAVASIVKEEYYNLYRQVRTSRFIDDEKEELGFSTNRKSKGYLVDNIGNWLGKWDGDDWLVEPRFILHDPPTLVELNRYQIDPKTGEAGAPKGANDDLVMASGFLIEGAISLLTGNDSPRSMHIAPWEW